MQATEQKVLIVDDDAAVARVLQAGLLEGEIAADCAGSAEEALVLLQRRQFDVILTDVKMPGAWRARTVQTTSFTSIKARSSSSRDSRR